MLRSVSILNAHDFFVGNKEIVKRSKHLLMEEKIGRIDKCILGTYRVTVTRILHFCLKF